MRKIFAASVFIMLISIGCFQKPSLDNDLSLLIESERSFAKSSAEQGIRTAFLNYLSDEAIIFRPGPINARQFYLDRQEISGLLTWEPEYADISLAGDLGYTTGPYEFRSDKTSIDADTYGHYVSIWKKQADGTWRVVLDCGIVHPKPDAKIIPAEFLIQKCSSSTRILTTDELSREQQKLFETDIAFLESETEIGFANAFLKYGDDQARFFRMNTFPIIGKENMISSTSLQPEYSSGTPIAANIAASGDLGYTYGLSEVERDKKKYSNSYLRIWKRPLDGQWRIVLDLENPISSKD